MKHTMVSRRDFLRASAAFGAGGLLAACGGVPATQEPTGDVSAAADAGAASAAGVSSTPPTGEATTVRLLTTHGAALAPFIEASLANFATEHPEVKVEWEDLTEGYYDRLNVQLASGTLPDVVNLRSFDMYDWYRLGNLYDISPFLTSDAGVKPDDLVTAILQTCQFDGKYFGLPYDASVEIVYYNKDMFDQAGVAVPEDSWTWDDMLEKAKALSKPDEQTYGFARLPPYTDWQVEPWILSNGGKIINDERTEWTMVGPEAEGAIQFIVDLVKTHNVAPPAEAQSDVNLFVIGKAGMYVSGQWEIPGNREAVKFNWDVAALPTGPKSHSPITHGGTYVMNAKTKVPEAAWQIQRWITAQDDWQSNVYGASGYSIPSLKTVSSDAWLKPINEGKPPKNAQVVLDELEKAVAGSLWPNFQKIAAAMTEEMEKIFVSNVPVAQALDAVKKRADEAIKEAAPS